MAKPLPRFLLGGIGLVVLTVGVIKVVGVAGTAPAIALLAAGVLLLISPFVIDRIERFSVTRQEHFAGPMAKRGAETANKPDATLRCGR